jgi:ligand-binding SRPBCC domain-containing protein
MAALETRSTIGCDRKTLFDFLIRPHQAQVLSPPDFKVTLVEAPEVLALDSVIRFQVEAFGIRQNFTHQVIAFDSPERFVERQIEGLFGFYEHEHALEPDEGGVMLIERVTFEPPGGMAGMLLTEKRIRENLTKNLAHSHAELQRCLGSSGSGSV